MFASNDILDSNDLALLRGVLEEVCDERDLSIKDAEYIAYDLVNWYLFGVRIPSDLKSMLKPL